MIAYKRQKLSDFRLICPVPSPSVATHGTCLYPEGRATQYNPRAFLRQVPNALQARFFLRYDAFSAFDWSHQKETQVEAVFDCWQQMPEAEKRQVGAVFRQVHSMASSRGTRVLVEAARDRGLEIASDLGARKNAHDRAIWCFLDHPEVFANARTLDHIEGLPKCSWEKRNGLPKKPIEFTATTVSDLSRRISEYYLARDGRGENCKVEYRQRSFGLDSFFAYPADYVEDIMGYDDDGELAQTPWSGALEVAFNYTGAAGSVEMYAEGGRQVRDDLSEIFSQTVLGQDNKPVPLQSEPYDLEVFKNPAMAFPADPVDRLVSVRVKTLRVQVHGRIGGQITIDTGKAQASVYELIRANFAEDKATLKDVTIVEATLHAQFEQPGRRKRSTVFKLSASRCDLGDGVEEQILRRYLKLWGIERDA